MASCAADAIFASPNTSEIEEVTDKDALIRRMCLQMATKYKCDLVSVRIVSNELRRNDFQNAEIQKVKDLAGKGMLYKHT